MAISLGQLDLEALKNYLKIVQGFRTVDDKSGDTEFVDACTIIDVKPNENRISVLCGDNKIIDFKAELYNKWDIPFTKNFISLDVHKGERIS